MRATDLLWLIFLLPFLIPRIRALFVARRRKALVNKLERSRDSKVITLIHDVSGSPLLDMLLGRFITKSDANEVKKKLRELSSDKRVDILLHTPGGLVLASKQITRALLRHEGEVNVFVPYYAMSGGTFLTLAADNIYMDPNANLGPINPQIGRFPALSIKRAVEKKKPEDIDDTTLVLGDISEKALRQVESFANEILLKNGYSQRVADDIVAELTSPDYTHDRLISFELAKRIGLRVSADFPEEFYALMDLYVGASSKGREI